MRPVQLVILAAFLHPVTAQTSKQVQWARGSWKQVGEEAHERNVPILVAFIQDGEEANERLVDDILRDKKVVQYSDWTVPVICSRKDHGTERVKGPDGEYSACTRFGAIACTTHIAHEIAAFTEFFSGSGVKTPQVLLCKPTLEVIEVIIDVASPESYAAMIRRAQNVVGSGLDRKMYAEAKEALTRASNLIRQKKPREAWDICAPVVAIGGPSLLVRKAVDIHDRVTRDVTEVLRKAEAAAERKDYWTAVPQVQDLIDEFKGTPHEKTAKSLQKTLKKSSEAREVERLLKKQERFLKDWDRAAAFEQKADYIAARDAYADLVEKADGLPLAARAKERLAAFEADADIRRLLRAADRGRESDELLRQADRLREDGKVSEAKALYRRLVDEFAGTAAATKAKEYL